MNVRNRLRLNTLASAITVLVVAFVVGAGAYRMNDALAKLDLADEILNGLFQGNTLLHDYVESGNERAKVQWFAEHTQLGKELQAALEKFADTRSKEIIGKMIKDHEATLKIFKGIVENKYNTGSADAPAEIWKAIENRYLTQSKIRLYDKLLNIQELRSGARDRVFSELKFTSACIVFFIIIMAAVAAVGSWTLNRFISVRISKLRQGSSAIGKGELEHRIDIQGSDELADLSSAFNTMTEQLKRSYDELQNEMNKRKQAGQALRQSEQRIRDVMDNMVAMIGITTPDGTLIEANRTALSAANLKPEDVLGKPFEECYWWVWSNEARWRLREAINKAATGTGCRYDAVIRVGEGEFRTIDFMLSPLFDHEGQVAYLIPSATDITERKRAEEALRQLNETLEQKIAERTELAQSRARQLQALAIELIDTEERERSKFAHLLHDDLQQMLASAKLQLQAVATDNPAEKTLAEISLILKESINKSRNLSHELSPPVLQSSGLIGAIQWLSQQMYSRFHLKVDLISPESLPDNLPLKHFIFRSVQELLFNIVKHAGVNHACIVVSGSDSHITASVIDEGRGFNPDIAGHSNMGFGLMTIRERANYVGGSFTIDSHPGRGSRFTLTVPVNISERHNSQTIPEITDARSTRTTASEKIRVLFVDDHHVMRKGLVNLMIGQADIHVVGEAANGHDALEKVHQLNPNVVVMDISMPEMDGIEATRRIKTQWPYIRVVGLSMYEDDESARTMLAAGAESFVLKTSSPKELLQAIYGNQDKVSCPQANNVPFTSYVN